VTDNKSLLGRAALLLATFIWGISFVLMDFALGSVPTLFILAIRFSGAAVIMLLLCLRELKKLDLKYLGGGILMGVLLLTAYIFQTYGLGLTTPGKNAFLTSVYCIIVPFFAWFLEKKRPDKFNVIAALVCVAGIGLITLNSDLSINLGDALTLVCGFFYALHIIATAHNVKGRSFMLLALIQFATAGILAWIGTLLFEPFPTAISMSTGLNLAFLTVMSTALCLSLQIFGQKHTPPSQAAVIMTFEAVFGAAASVLFSGELLSFQLFCGFLLTFAAVIISETKLAFFHKKDKAENTIENTQEPIV
jgi:drug/metabolite transporter (DMT)-like permease